MMNFKHLKNIKALFETFLNKTRYSLVIFAMALVVCLKAMTLAPPFESNSEYLVPNQDWAALHQDSIVQGVKCGSVWFLVVLGGCWWFFVVLGVSWWFLVVLGGY